MASQVRALTRQLPVGDFLLVAIPRAQFANEPTGTPPEAAASTRHPARPLRAALTVSLT